MTDRSALMCSVVAVTAASLTSSTVAMSETVWTYSVQAAVNASYFDPVTRKLYKARTAGATPTSISFDAASDTVTWNTHGRANSDVFAFAVSGGGTAPTPLSPSTPYPLINAATNTFQLSLTRDGDPINFATSGSPTITGYINSAFDNPAAWQDRGPPNRWKMFDQSNQTATTAVGSIQVVVAPSSRVDTVAALALAGVSEIYFASSGTSASRTNNLLQSCTFDDAAWTKTNASVTANAVRAPDGTMTADKLVGSATNGVHTISQTSGGQLKSVYVRAGELTKGTFATAGGSGWFDLGDGTITLNSGTGSFFIERVNNSLWWRIWTPTPASGFTIGLRNAAGADSFAGSASQGFYIWGAQSEAVTADSRPTGPIVTTGSAVTTSTDTHIEIYDLTDTAFSDYQFAGIYSPATYRRDMATSTIPPWASQSITVTLVGPGTVECGNLIFALSRDIGAAEYASSVGTRNFSKGIDPDDFGNVDPVIRGFSKSGRWNCALKERRSDAIKNLFDLNRATPNLFLMAPDNEAETGMQWKERGIIYGLAKSWDFTFFQPKDDKYVLQCEGYA